MSRQFHALAILLVVATFPVTSKSAFAQRWFYQYSRPNPVGVTTFGSSHYSYGSSVTSAPAGYVRVPVFAVRQASGSALVSQSVSGLRTTTHRAAAVQPSQVYLRSAVVQPQAYSRNVILQPARIYVRQPVVRSVKTYVIRQRAAAVQPVKASSPCVPDSNTGGGGTQDFGSSTSSGRTYTPIPASAINDCQHVIQPVPGPPANNPPVTPPPVSGPPANSPPVTPPVSGPPANNPPAPAPTPDNGGTVDFGQ